MAQTLVPILVHLVFSTKHRKELIVPEIEAALHAYMTGTLKNLGGPCLHTKTERETSENDIRG